MLLKAFFPDRPLEKNDSTCRMCFSAYLRNKSDKKHVLHKSICRVCVTSFFLSDCTLETFLLINRTNCNTNKYQNAYNNIDHFFLTAPQKWHRDFGRTCNVAAATVIIFHGLKMIKRYLFWLLSLGIRDCRLIKIEKRLR